MENISIGIIAILTGIVSVAMNIKMKEEKLKKWLRVVWLLLAVTGIVLGIYDCYMGVMQFT